MMSLEQHEDNTSHKKRPLKKDTLCQNVSECVNESKVGLEEGKTKTADFLQAMETDGD